MIRTSPTGEPVQPQHVPDPIAYPQFLENDAVNTIVSAINESLRRFGSVEEQKTMASINWICRSKLFTFSICLTRKGKDYLLSMSINNGFTSEFEILFKRRWRVPMLNVFNGNENKKISLEVEHREQIKAALGLDLFPILVQLNYFDFLRIEQKHMMIEKKLSKEFDEEAWHLGFNTFLAFARLLVTAERLNALPHSPQPICPYCRGEILEKERTITCEKCGTAEHEECWKEMRGCAVYGCLTKSGNLSYR